MSLIEHTSTPAPRFRRGGHIYVGRPPAPLSFPSEEEVPETNPNFEKRVVLYQSVKAEVEATSTVGSDQFVYFDPTEVAKRCAPDLFVKLRVVRGPFDVWKVWEHGAPELGVEIVSKSDRPEDEWGQKLRRYRGAGVLEVVRFDADDAEQPIRVWDRVDGELVERAADDPDNLACQTLGLWWTVVDMPGIGLTPRLARGRNGTDLLPTPDEARVRAEKERALAEKERALAEQERALAEQGRAVAEHGRALEAEARSHAEQERDALRKELEQMRAAAAQPRAKAAKKPPVPRKKPAPRPR